MAKQINVGKISLSAKGIAWAIVGFIILIIIWRIATWVTDKVSTGASGTISKFTQV